MSIVMTTTEALARYEAAFNEDRLIQAAWHNEQDGRHLACALGILGDEIDVPSKCPATVMPQWLAQMVPGFFDRQKFDDAKDWGLRFYKALDRIGGNVPFSAVHDWHANTVCQLGIDAAELRKRDPAPHKVLRALHLRALAGEKISADEWQPVLFSAYADANAYASANAYAFASANAFAFASASAFADVYVYVDANANANASASAFADASANAFADASAYAFAFASASAFADVYVYVDANANANANASFADASANAFADANAYAWKRLADGMVDALNRVEA